MSVSQALPTDSDVLRSYQKMVQERAQRAAERLQRLRVVLAELGVARVAAEYDGCGDSGQIESIEFRTATNEVCGEVTDEVEKEVEELLYDLLEVRHGGWENNDGAFGTFAWNVSDSTMQHEHNSRYMDYETSEYEGFGGLLPPEEDQ